MNIRMLCHVDQREKSHVSNDEIFRYRSKRQEKRCALFQVIRSKQIISLG